MVRGGAGDLNASLRPPRLLPKGPRSGPVLVGQTPTTPVGSPLREVTMADIPAQGRVNVGFGASKPYGPSLEKPPMLNPTNAWRILCNRTGGSMARSTFYRWLSSGRIYSIRLGFRILVPWPALETAIKQCLSGERI